MHSAETSAAFHGEGRSLVTDSLHSFKTDPTLASSSFAYALAARQALGKAWADGSAPDTFSDVRILHRGCANEAAYWTFDTSTGEQYVVEVSRRRRL